MSTLHIFRSEPDEQVREMVSGITRVGFSRFALYDEIIDYDLLIDAIFGHDRVISWW